MQVSALLEYVLIITHCRGRIGKRIVGEGLLQSVTEETKKFDGG